MTPREQVMNYQPRQDVAHVYVDHAGNQLARGVWEVVLSDDTTVVELALLMAGLRSIGREVAAIPPDRIDGLFVLRPIETKTRAPTCQDIAHILERGFSGRLPGLLLKQAD